jgi:hypothetical protein
VSELRFEQVRPAGREAILHDWLVEIERYFPPEHTIPFVDLRLT